MKSQVCDFQHDALPLLPPLCPPAHAAVVPTAGQQPACTECPSPDACTAFQLLGTAPPRPGGTAASQGAEGGGAWSVGSCTPGLTLPVVTTGGTGGGSGSSWAAGARLPSPAQGFGSSPLVQPASPTLIAAEAGLAEVPVASPGVSAGDCSCSDCCRPCCVASGPCVGWLASL